MLTLQLTLDNKQITVRVDGRESHSFSLLDLGQTDKEWKDFFKDPRPYGENLFRALFKDRSEARKAFDDLSKQAERTIVLVLESSELDGVAWEYAYHDNAYIVEDFAFIRALPEKERPNANGRMNKSVERLPLLFIPANPLVDLSGEPMRELDIESEWREMKQFIEKSNAPFDLIELRPATPAALQSVMARFQNGMITHFSGHGAATEDGTFLLFENENGSSNPLEAREFMREVKDQAWIGFLSACQSAVAERTEYSNLARELVKAGVPFALGMQFNLPDLFAPNISGQFYNYLSQGHSVPEAARQARRAVKRENEFYVGMIALYAAHPDEPGKMEWSGSGARTLPTFAEADVSDLPMPSGFIGRQRELMNIGTNLLGKKKPNTVTLHGAGGIGKTALMRQTLLHFAPSFESALAIALDPLPSLESVLGRLERFLNLPSPCSNDSKERERIVRERLTSKRVLLGLDNFETLNYALNDKNGGEEKTAKSLHSFFKYLAANGTTLCVTSREVTNLGGELIIDIEGLPNDIGGRLFQDNVVRQKVEIYIEKIQQVSEMVGGHPLALRLLASAFDDQIGISLDQYIESLQSLLPEAHDRWTEEARHTDLDACFAFSLENLPKNEEGRKLRQGLLSLSVFVSFFAVYIASPIIAGKWPTTQEEDDTQKEITNKIVHLLWERGMLERLKIIVRNENFYLYRLHPALQQFAEKRVTSEDLAVIQRNHKLAMQKLALRAAPSAKGGIHNNPSLVPLVRLANPDLLKASTYQKDKETSTLLLNTASIQQQFGNLEEAMRLNKQALNIAEENGDVKGKSQALSQTAYILFMQGRLDAALDLYQQALAINEDLDDLLGKSILWHEIANIKRAKGNWGEALNLYKQAFENFDSLGEIESMSTTLHEIAKIHAMRGDLDNALILYQQAIKYFEISDNIYLKSASIHEMARIYVFQNELNKAKMLYLQALQIDEELDNRQGISATLHELATIDFAQGKLEKAIELFQQSLEIKEGLRDWQGKAMTFGMIGQVYWAKKLYSEAIKSIMSGIMILIQLDSEPQAQQGMSACLIEWRQELGSQIFDTYWSNVFGDLEPPNWLTQSGQTSTTESNDNMTPEQFIERAIRSVREKHPEADKYLKSAKKIAADESVPVELNELGRVLSRILVGDTNVDLSRLPENLAGAIRAALK